MRGTRAPARHGAIKEVLSIAIIGIVILTGVVVTYISVERAVEEIQLLVYAFKN